MIAEINTLYIAVLDKTSTELVIFMSLINKTMSMQIVRTISDANEQAIAIKKVFKMRLSLDLNATTIEKFMIERNIKNSTITKITNKASVNIIEIFPVNAVDNKSFKTFINPGFAYIIKIETIRLANAITISISAVKNFEFMS